MISVGILSIVKNKKLINQGFPINGACLSENCNFIFRIHEDSQRPLYFYIGFENFYLNDLKVANSKDDLQLAGFDVQTNDLNGGCNNYRTVEDARRFYPNFMPESDPKTLISPCGLLPLLYSNCNINSQSKIVQDKYCSKCTT